MYIWYLLSHSKKMELFLENYIIIRSDFFFCIKHQWKYKKDKENYHLSVKFDCDVFNPGDERKTTEIPTPGKIQDENAI